jgi:two-component system NtrC family sensor kinase
VQKLLARIAGWRLQSLLVISFVLTAAITIAVATLVTYSLINNYLEGAQQDRVGRDMDLANAFYNNKLSDISGTSRRLASMRSVRHNLEAASNGDPASRLVLEDAIANQLASLPPEAQRFVVVTDAHGKSITGGVAPERRGAQAERDRDWSQLPILSAVLEGATPVDATEVIPAENLSWVGLEEQAFILLIDTEKAAPEPFDPREGTAGLALASASPVLSDDGRFLGMVLVGHLFNNDFTLVDRIKEVAGVDTVTIFFGDLRVSTNVLDEDGKRAIGTRVSQEVYDTVLVRGEAFTGPAYVVNQDYITRYEPLHDIQGDIVGILYVGAKMASFQQLLLSFRWQMALIAGSTILLAMLIAIPLAWSVTRPLSDLANATRKVAHGDWSVRVPFYGPLEMKTLAESFNTMVMTLKGTQEQLVQQEKLASVGQLAAGVAHEINNPLGSVLLYADILRKETPEDEAQTQADLEMIINEATRCKVIVNDLLNFSRQNEVLAQDTDLNALLGDISEEASKQDLFDDVDLVADLEPGLPLIQADPLQLRQVFLNLMNNAAEAMPNGGSLTLRTRKGPGEGWVTAEVADTGIGIAPENMKKIYTPFFTTKPIGKGTGLGLSIIYGIIKMHQGQIVVKSEPHKGTTFTISLLEQLPTEEAGNVLGPA